jgi:hypothetical protein
MPRRPLSKNTAVTADIILCLLLTHTGYLRRHKVANLRVATSISVTRSPDRQKRQGGAGWSDPAPSRSYHCGENVR